MRSLFLKFLCERLILQRKYSIILDITITRCIVDSAVLKEQEFHMAVHLIYKSLPTVALRGMVVFPGMRLHFEVGRDKSIQAIQAAVRDGQRVFLVT